MAMINEETFKERQENELEALKAIYGDAIVDIRMKSARNIWQPLDVVISLSPLRSSSTPQEIYVSVDLHITCSEGYPNKVPKFVLKNKRGISSTLLNDLQKKLEEKANNYVGEVMIFQLAQYVESFLYEHNKPGVKSFYDEMLKRQEKKRKEESLAKQKEREVQREGILNEFNEKQEILKLENKRMKERNTSSENYHGRQYEMNAIMCDCKGSEVIEFSNNLQKIYRGKCICHSSNNSCILYNGLDLETGDFYVIAEWRVPFKHEDTQIFKQLNSVEQECTNLIKMKHINIVGYLNMKYVTKQDQNIVSIYLLQESVIGLNCASLLLNQTISVDLDIIRHIAIGVLNAIEFLHINNVVHKEISLSNIYLSKEGIVKLVNHSLNKRLTDLVMTPETTITFNKESDIFMFGLAMLSLFRGQDVRKEALILPTSVPSEFYDFLTRCLSKDERERSTATQLLSHSFLHAPVNKTILKHNTDGFSLINEVTSENILQDNAVSPGLSRIETEFEVLKYIGKGAFGDVIKVRNKLDGGYYAIKKIELNSKSKQLNKKITREVKLLSKLNHENVVRYYNAWIESAVIHIDGEKASHTGSNSPKINKLKEFTLKDDFELLAPTIGNIEWSVNYESKSQPNVTDSSSSDEDISEDSNWRFRVKTNSNSESVKFEDSNIDKISMSLNEVNQGEGESFSESAQTFREIQFLFIQMEFCDKSTLRTAIDSDLYTDTKRVWRLFREIVEGLAHIHQQGMIHRDLKPVNIFLDSNDHVKIGDFGLATTSLFCKQDSIGNKNIHGDDKYTPSLEDLSLTGHVGTALYTAPEINTSTKTIYDQKVDIYSLGIIFFEMCYKPLVTQMERMKVLSNVRTADVKLPKDFQWRTDSKQECIIKWLLNHDVSLRPSSQELLQSNLIPAPVLEEEKLRNMFLFTLNNPQLKSYKFLMASCFKQPVTPAQDLTYNMDLLGISSKNYLQIKEFVCETVVKIFKLHGGQNINTPLLLPRSKYYNNSESCVKLMTHAGSIVSLPHDLRVPFARYVAWNEITQLRRYAIERVYREKRVFGFHPTELYECAFDIITPTPDNLMSDGEILYLVCEILEELPGLKNKNYFIRLNHTLLLKAIFLHCGIKEKHDEIYRILSDEKHRESKNLHIKMVLQSLKLPNNGIATFLNLIELKQPFSRITNSLQSITKNKSNEAALIAEKALQDLKLIIKSSETLGVTCSIFITPGLVYNVNQYSGMMCQFLGEFRKRKRNVHEVIAAGGRYDEMIKYYRHIKEKTYISNKEIKQSATGISISLDRLVQAVQDKQNREGETTLDVVVSSLDSQNFVNEKSQIVKDLWLSGIRTVIIEAMNVEELQEVCVDLNVSSVILLKEKGIATLQMWEKGKFQEKVVSILEIKDTFLRATRNIGEVFHEQQATISIRPESKAYNCDHCHDTLVSIDFVTNEKLSSNTRKRYENQIRSQLDSALKRFTGEIIVLATSLTSLHVKSMCSSLELNSETEFQTTANYIIEKNQRQRGYLMEVCDEIYKYKKKNFIIVLYSISDQFYKIIF